MIRRLACCAVLPATLAGQTVLESGGGIGRLDATRNGGLAAFGASSRIGMGAFRLDMHGEAQDYAELGSIARVEATAQWHQQRGDWQLAVGPAALAGNGIGERWAHAVGGAAGITRTHGRTTIEVDGLLASASLAGQATMVSRGRARIDVSLGRVRVGTVFATTSVGDSVVRDGHYFDPGLNATWGADTIPRRRLTRVEDIAVHADWRSNRLAVRGELGRRGAPAATTQTWWRLRASYSILPTTALVLQSHRMPTDLLLGVRGGRTTTLGLALTWPHGGNKDTPLAPLETVRTETHRVLLILDLPAREQVLLTGEPTGWQPLAMERRPDGRWQRWLDVAPGTYRLNVALDGGAWVAPPGSTPVRDDFGGLVGLVTL